MNETKTPQNVPSFVQPTKQVKPPMPSVQHVVTSIPTATSDNSIPKPTSNGNRRNRKACFVCKSLDYLIKDCDYHDQKIAQTHTRNHASMGHHKHYARRPLSNPQRHMVPTVVVPKSKLVPINTARPITVVVPKIKVTRPRQDKPVVTKTNSPPRWLINRSPSPKASTFPPKVIAVKAPMVNAPKGVQGKWEWKPKCLVLDHVSRNTSASMTLKRFDYNDALRRSKSGNPQHALKDKEVIDSGCSRHITRNMSYLSDFEELNGGYELKFNIFSVSQMCDKKNGVLFTDAECLVLSSEVKLPDERQVLLRVPRENNMYNVNLKNIVPSGDLTCLLSKATLDESNLRHRRLGHINFKTMNKLVKGLENQLSLKVKVIRSDNGTEFKKNDLNQFYGMEGIKREFSAEAVNTACYVQNRVLVTKPQNKTLYELLHGRTPSIGFMRPFGCLVTILNTLDSLGKFDGKVDEGFSVGYSVSSKAFRVFNSRTRIIQETLHVNFLENKPNVAGSGPTWLFDIDTLTKTMNYQPVTAGNQSNPSAGVQEHFNAEKAEEKSDQQYVLFPVWSSGSTNPQNTNGDAAFDEKKHEFDEKKCESEVNVSLSSSAQSKKHDDKTKKEAKGKSHVESLTGYRNLSVEFEDFSDNSINDDNAAGTLVLAVGQLSPNSTNTFSAAGPSAVVASPTHRKSSCIDTSQLLDDPNMPELEDITYFDNEDDVATQTRSMTRVARDQGGLSQINNDDFHTCTKWVFRNKNDERGIVVRNKAQLVAQGHIQDEGIDYEEVFAPVARIEAIRLFLAYASFMGFMVYQMYVKSAFLYETIEEEVYVCQPPGFEDLDYPDKVYKVVKALYGLHQAPRAWYETSVNYLLENGFQRGKIDQILFIKRQKDDILLIQIYVDDIIFGSKNKDLCKAFEKLMKEKFQMSSMVELTFFLGLQVKQKKDGIFISQDKYVVEILRKFGLTEGKSASTPIVTEKPLLKDPNGEDVDVHTYRSMIGSLMYLTSSRLDIMFAVCAYAHFQVTPKASHLHVVNRIFRYLKGKSHLGLWYPKDLPFDLVAYSYSDYAGASLDRKSTTGGCQFFGCRLISWQCKKKTVVATSSTKAEYIAAASCCAQVLWIQNQLLDY
nr:putative ribonuclease H-like domain-containing protein [Tanacetum cinerariifolium]